MNKPKDWSKREWLNPPGSYDNGWVKYNVATEEWDKTRGGRGVDIYGSLLIADCSRTITLNLDVSTKRDYNRVIKKLAKLRKVIDQLEDGINEAWEYKQEEEM